jgi:hypothetical protein
MFTFIAVVVGIVFTSGCTHTRVVSLRYTPLIQTQRLADKTSPQLAVVGNFTDARSQAKLASQRLNPINVHTYEFESRDDVPTLVRSAFVDALLKAGFDVPMQTDSTASPFLQLTGKVITYQAGTHTGWSTVTATADVAVELTVVPRSGSPVTLTVQGQCKMEQKEFMNLESAIPDSLDRALQECAKKFLENETFLSLLKR